jgi:hypothetical protein
MKYGRSSELQSITVLQENNVKARIGDPDPEFLSPHPVFNFLYLIDKSMLIDPFYLK